MHRHHGFLLPLYMYLAFTTAVSFFSASSRADDNYEPNDSLHTAFNLAGHNETWLSSINGPGDMSDEDWYSISLSNPQTRVMIECDFDPENEDIDLELYDSSGSFLTEGTNGDGEYIDTTVPSPGTYYIRISAGAPSALGAQYDLFWEDLDPTLADPYEPNDTRSAAWDGDGKRWAGEGLLGKRGWPFGGDDDWYQLDIGTNLHRVVIHCNFFHEDGDIDLRLFDSTGSEVAQSRTSVGVRDNEFIDYFVSSTVLDYYLKVEGAQPLQPYNLVWENLVPTIDDDPYELFSYPIDNDSWASAWYPADDTLVFPGWANTPLSRFFGLAAQKDADWYRIRKGVNSDRILVALLFSHADGDLTLDLYDDTGAPLSSASSSDDNEYIDFSSSVGPRDLLIQVSGDNAGNEYDLWWNDIQSGEDDAYEENDSRATAFWPGFNWNDAWLTAVEGVGIQRDEDWYRIHIDPGFLQIEIDLLFDDAQGDLDLELVDSAGSVLDSAASVTDNERIAHEVPSAGDYYLRVYGFSSPSNDIYDLRWQSFLSTVSTFTTGTENWTWFDAAPQFEAPAHNWNTTQNTLDMVETPSNRIVFGSWESPKDPALGVQPERGRIYRGEFDMTSTDGAACPGFRFRGVTSHMSEVSPGQWEPDFTNQDFNASHELYYSTLDMFHIAGREPGPAGKQYTLLVYPEQTETLKDADMNNLFACDLLDLDTFDNDAGLIRINEVRIDSIRRPALSMGNRVASLSYNDASGAQDFSAWNTNVDALSSQVNTLALDAYATAGALTIDVNNTDQWFVATLSGAGARLSPGAYYVARFRIASTNANTGDFGPTVRAGFYSTDLVFSMNKELPGGSTNAAFGPAPKYFEIWMVAPSPESGGQTEPIGLRLQSYLQDNNTGFPFNANVSGTVTCDEIETYVFSPIP